LLDIRETSSYSQSIQGWILVISKITLRRDNMVTKWYVCSLFLSGGVVFLIICLLLPTLALAQAKDKAQPQSPYKLGEPTPVIPVEQWKLVPKTAAEAIDQVVMANRILAYEGILDALGHVSLRNPENPRTFFQARSLSPLEVTKKDILEIELDGTVVTKSTMRPYGERIIHGAILKARPEMSAVFHGHIPAVIPFSVTGVPMRPVCHVGSFLWQGVPVYDDYEPGGAMLISTMEEGERIARHLGNRRAHLLRGHGCDIVAESLLHLVASAIYMRDNATMQFQSLQMGKEPKYLSEEEAKSAMERALFGETPLSRMWGYWTARVRAAMPDMK
jgi:3-hydroxy-2-methylpyridine-4,5-dicarboxylate 4-decarboxylase